MTHDMTNATVSCYLSFCYRMVLSTGAQGLSGVSAGGHLLTS